VTRRENQKRFVMRTGGYSVNLTKRVKTEEGLRYCPVAESVNGRVKPDLVVVNGTEERHGEGAYYLEWREDGKRVRLSVGKDAQDAAARRQRKEAELNALNSGVSVLPENGNGHPSVAGAVARFLEETELTKKPKTLAAYATALNYFTESCPKDPSARHRAHRSAEILRLPAREKEAGSAQRLQQVRERDDVPEGVRDSRPGGQERLAALHRRRTGDVRTGRAR
jgi:hypothetical protein